MTERLSDHIEEEAGARLRKKERDDRKMDVMPLQIFNGYCQNEMCLSDYCIIYR